MFNCFFIYLFPFIFEFLHRFHHSFIHINKLIRLFINQQTIKDIEIKELPHFLIIALQYFVDHFVESSCEILVENDLVHSQSKEKQSQLIQYNVVVPINTDDMTATQFVYQISQHRFDILYLNAMFLLQKSFDPLNQNILGSINRTLIAVDIQIQIFKDEFLKHFDFIAQ